MSNVLIVDDAAFMRESIKMMLKEEQFNVVAEAKSGMEAILKYKEYKPDIVTMDITMPEMSGIEALIQIKAYDPSAKVIMISAMGQEGMIKEAVINGAVNFIVKPFKKPKLLEVLKKFS